MKEKKKLVPKRRFKGFEEEWEEYELGEVAESFEYGLNAPAIKFDGINKYLRITDIDDDTRLFNEKEITSPKIDFSIADNYLLQKGDVLFARTGASVGKTYRYQSHDGKVYYAGFLIRARFKPDFDPEFIFQNTLTAKYHSFIRETSQRSGQPGVNAQEYAGFKLMMPSKEEQKKIGQFFKLLDKRIANQERKIAKIKSLKSAYLTEMFPQEGETVPKRRFKEFKGEWKEVELGHALKYEQPTNYIVKNENYDDRYNTPVLTAGQSFILGFTNEKQGIKQANSNNPVIIFDDFTTSSHFVEFPFKVKSSALKILIPDTSAYDSYFIFQSLKNIKYVPQSHERHWISIFSKFIIRKPKLEEQQKIGQFFKNLDDQIATEERKLAKLKAMKEAYLEEMFV